MRVLRIGGSGFRVVTMGFWLLVHGRLFVLVVLGLAGRDYCGVGEIFLIIPFVLGWLLEIDWILGIG